MPREVGARWARSGLFTGFKGLLLVFGFGLVLGLGGNFLGIFVRCPILLCIISALVFPCLC